MSEMLANQYFMARKYLEAEIELEGVINKNPSNKSALKKIIVCYTHNNKIDKALDILCNLITEDIHLIIDTDPIKDDCPCFELIEEVEKKKLYSSESLKHYIMLGIFWLYCNYEVSLTNFIKASEIDSQNVVLNQTISVIKNYMGSVQLKHSLGESI